MCDSYRGKEFFVKKEVKLNDSCFEELKRLRKDVAELHFKIVQLVEKEVWKRM